MSFIRKEFLSENSKDQELETYQSATENKNLYILYPSLLAKVFASLNKKDQQNAKEVCYTWNLAINPKSAILKSQSAQPKTLVNETAIAELPEEVMCKIFDQLPPKNLARASMVCKDWHRITNDSRLWAKFFSEDTAQKDKTKNNYGKDQLRQIRENLSNNMIMNQVKSAEALLNDKKRIHYINLMGNAYSIQTQINVLARDPERSVSVMDDGLPITVKNHTFKVWYSHNLFDSSQFVRSITNNDNASIALICPSDESEINTYTNQIANSCANAIAIFVIREEDQFTLGTSLSNKVILENRDTKTSFFQKVLTMTKLIAESDNKQQKSCRIS